MRTFFIFVINTHTHTHTQLKCIYFKHRQLTQLERKLMRSLKLIYLYYS